MQDNWPEFVQVAMQTPRGSHTGIMGRLSSALTGVLVLAGLCSGQSTIHGTVLDDNEKPVKSATVYATPLDRPMSSVAPQDISDECGAFSISRLDWGKYSVWAAKPDEGYPELHFAFYTGFHAKQAVVRVSPQHQSATVVLHLGKKAGILKGTVVDAVTGKPVNANVEFRSVSEPENFLSGSGLANAQFRILIPSDVAVTMVVSLAGYNNWSYTMGQGPARHAIVLRPGEVLPLDIRLQPKQ